MMESILKTISVSLLLLVAPFLYVSCGSDDDDSDDASQKEGEEVSPIPVITSFTGSCAEAMTDTGLNYQLDFSFKVSDQEGDYSLAEITPVGTSAIQPLSKTLESGDTEKEFTAQIIVSSITVQNGTMEFELVVTDAKENKSDSARTSLCICVPDKVVCEQ